MSNDPGELQLRKLNITYRTSILPSSREDQTHSGLPVQMK